MLPVTTRIRTALTVGLVATAILSLSGCADSGSSGTGAVPLVATATPPAVPLVATATLPPVTAIPTPPPTLAVTAPPRDDLAALSDEFDNATTLAQWKNLATVEGFPNQAETLDINTTSPGQLYLMPYTSGWFADFRGILLYKEVTGDFDVTTRIEATSKSGPVPKRTYSLGGLMARTPRTSTPATWLPLHENWIFINTGYGDTAPNRKGKAQMETKTTVESDSTLELVAIPNGPVDIRIVRIGPTFVMLYRPAGRAWVVSKRYQRPDMPATLQVGLDAYTNWESIDEEGGAEAFNRTLVTHPALPPDLLVHSDYLRFTRPHVSAAVRNQLADRATADERVLQLLSP